MEMDSKRLLFTLSLISLLLIPLALCGQPMKRCDKEYSPKYFFGSPFSLPYQISFYQGKTYVLDWRDFVVSFDTLSPPYGVIGMNTPHTIELATGSVVDKNGNLYISDCSSNNIQKFDVNGKFLKMFGHSGSGVGQLDCPTHLAVDNNDNLLVLDYFNHRIHVSTSLHFPSN